MDLNQFRTFRVATCDLNGQMRGKRLPISDYDTVDQGAIKLPLSALNLDVWGLTSKTVHWCLKRGMRTEFFCQRTAGLFQCLGWTCRHSLSHVDV